MKLNHAFKLNEVAGEFMVIDTRGQVTNLSKVFCMNETAAWLWKKIGKQDFTEELLVEWICEEYDVTEEQAAKDVAGLVALWLKSEMVTK